MYRGQVITFLSAEEEVRRDSDWDVLVIFFHSALSSALKMSFIGVKLLK